ncbi:hypothetical protein ACHAPQ_011507 [Fusarium lateritium]
MSKNVFGNISTRPIGYTPGAKPDTDDIRMIAAEIQTLDTILLAKQHSAQQQHSSILADGLRQNNTAGHVKGNQQGFNQTV